MVPPPIGRKNLGLNGVKHTIKGFNGAAPNRAEEPTFGITSAGEFIDGFNGAAPNRAEEHIRALVLTPNITSFNGAAPNRAEEPPYSLALRKSAPMLQWCRPQ